MTKFIACFVLMLNLHSAIAAAQEPQKKNSPSPEMQKVLAAQLGKWSQHQEGADGSSGQGEAVWQEGPGGMSLVENEYIRSSAGEMIGLSVTWWDEAVKGYRALWCDNKIKSGCLVMSKAAHWEGDQFVLADEFERDGKKLAYKEVESGITPSTYTLTSYIGEPGGELKPTSTIHATRITAANAESASAAKAEVLAALAERDKAFVAGDETTVAQSMSEDYLQTDVNGKIQDKQAWLNEYYRPMAPLLKSGKVRWVTFDRSDIAVRDLGDTFIVAGKMTIKHVGAFDPKDTTAPDSPPVTFSFTQVWLKRGGAWKLAVVHNAIPRKRE